MDKIEQLIVRFKKAKEELSKNINESYITSPNEVAMSEHTCKEEKCDHSVHKLELVKSEELLSFNELGQWTLNKSKELGASGMERGFFNMGHVHEILGSANHDAAKEKARDLVNRSNATESNRKKAHLMINASKNQGHLAQGISNFILAHPSENLKVAKSKAVSKDSTETPAAGVDFSAPPLGASPNVAKHWSKLPKEVQHWFHAHHGSEKGTQSIDSSLRGTRHDPDGSSAKTKTIATENKN
jgi:hypothetical protein